MLQFTARRAAAIVTCVAFAACAAPSYTPGFQNPDESAARLTLHPAVSPSPDEYITDGQSGDIYKCHHGVCTACKTVGSGAEGVGTGSGNLDGPQTLGSVIVANTGGQAILILDSFCNTVAVLSDSGFYPQGVAVALNGAIGVTNNMSTSFGPGNIVFYGPGSKQRIATGLLLYYFFGAFDKRGNFYNDGVTASGHGAVGVVRPGSTVDRPAGITGISKPAGIEVARNGTVNIIDQACACIQIYKSRAHVGTVTLSGAVLPVSFAFDKSNTHVWVTDYSAGTVAEYPYPGGGNPLAVLKGFTTVFGVGVLPPSRP